MHFDTARKAALAGFDWLFDQVPQFHYRDFPDYANIGDSAIAVGQYDYWAARKLSPLSAAPASLLTKQTMHSHAAVYLQGGGNLGGLYRGIGEHRYRLAEQLRPDTLLLQGPQSIHCPTSSARSEMLKRFASRPALRVAVRDESSFNALRDHVEHLRLVPDALHLAKPVDRPRIVSELGILKRMDVESAGGDYHSASFDWPRERIGDRARVWLNWRASKFDIAAVLRSRPPSYWEGLARRRYSTGLQLVGQHRRLVTDRLHGMLIGAKLGLKIQVVDNSNAKLSNYVDTWFGGDLDGVRFHKTFDSAVKAAGAN